MQRSVNLKIIRICILFAVNGVENVVLNAVCLVDIENIGPPWGVSPVRTPAPAHPAIY